MPNFRNAGLSGCAPNRDGTDFRATVNDSGTLRVKLEPKIENNERGGATRRVLRALARLPETRIGLAFAVVALGLSIAIDAPIVAPSPDAFAFVGLHYLLPIVTVLAACLIGLRDGAKSARLVYMLAIYASVLILHFNIKLWSPLINARLFDVEYQMLDDALRPLIDACLYSHRALASVLPGLDHYYLLGFMGMFYASFLYYAFRRREAFEEVFLGALLFQALGALAYLPAPALGPFVLERGANMVVTEVQNTMLGVHRAVSEEGPAWLAANAGDHLTAGVAAMPSLHVGGAVLFFVYAVKYSRGLAVALFPLLAFIVVESLSTRWHYIVDLPFGIALAFLSIWLVRRLWIENPKPAPAAR